MREKNGAFKSDEKIINLRRTEKKCGTIEKMFRELQLARSSLMRVNKKIYRAHLNNDYAELYSQCIQIRNILSTTSTPALSYSASHLEQTIDDSLAKIQNAYEEMQLDLNSVLSCCDYIIKNFDQHINIKEKCNDSKKQMITHYQFLVVEKEATYQDMIKNLTQGRVYPNICNNEESALALAAMNHLDLIVIEEDCITSNTASFCEKVLEISLNKNIKVFSIETSAPALNAESFIVLEKPVSMLFLEQLLETYFESALL